MEASIVDLRYKMKDVLHALDRNEEVTVLHRGKIKGTIVPVGSKGNFDARKHPLFGSVKAPVSTVSEQMDKLRGGRF
ncbi:MAG: type II toxin-antitoxin system Phd/YefM family antitoxin [Luteolibacter sp.]